MDYKVEIERVETVNGVMWIATCPALHGVTGGGESAQEALEILELEAAEMIEFMKSEGEPIPLPEMMLPEKNYSGRITYRPGKRLHKEICEYAEFCDVSLNTLISDAVSHYIGKSDSNIKLDELIKKIDELQTSINSHTKVIQNLGKYVTADKNVDIWNGHNKSSFIAQPLS